MVLSPWQSHCESSPGSFDECRIAPSGRRPKTKPDDDLGCESGPPVQAAKYHIMATSFDVQFFMAACLFHVMSIYITVTTAYLVLANKYLI